MTRKGFTVIEVLIAVVILSIGIIGLATTAGVVTRMIGQGQRYTEASSLATGRIERLRALDCDSTVAGTSTSGQYSLRWTVTTSGFAQRYTVVVQSPTGEGVRLDTFTTTRYCR